MNEAHDPPPRETEGDQIERRPNRTGRGPDRWQQLLGRGLFETIIVAVGVFLALFVDEWRETSEQQQLAQEARAALRTELLSNREAVLARMRRTAQLYVQAAAHPDEVAQYVFERRNTPLQLTDSAWTMTVQTGAIRWLEPDERTRIAEVYAGYQRMSDVIFEEMVRWTELGGFLPRPTPGEIRDRDKAIRVWRAFAQRAQLAHCVNAGRHERALGAPVQQQELMAFCVQRRPDEDPASIYSEWRKRGWLSTNPPRMLTEQ